MNCPLFTQRADHAEARKSHQRNSGDVSSGRLKAEEIGKAQTQFQERIDIAISALAFGEQIVGRIGIGKAVEIEKFER